VVVVALRESWDVGADALPIPIFPVVAMLSPVLNGERVVLILVQKPLDPVPAPPVQTGRPDETVNVWPLVPIPRREMFPELFL